MAHYLAKHHVSYDDPKAWELVHDLTEAFQYYLLKASNELAKEQGKCGYFDKTTYSDGILPIDTYKKDVDEIVQNNLKYDWKLLGINQEHGSGTALCPHRCLRRAVPLCQMPPTESNLLEDTCPLKSRKAS
ncbi:MAG: hypothetical protein CM15mV2_2010 [uncultured marine virus]|nr:MAG: hypothetical protein CM15mV2_2010 [uncultured marine virus]